MAATMRYKRHAIKNATMDGKPVTSAQTCQSHGAGGMSFAYIIRTASGTYAEGGFTSREIAAANMVARYDSQQRQG